jgi:MoxR-like ATPase
MMARVLDDVAAGATRWLVLTGPPGIGKARLAEEAAATVADAGGRVVWVNCPDERGCHHGGPCGTWCGRWGQC